MNTLHPPETTSLSLAAIALGFVAHVARHKDKVDFPNPLSEQEEWNRFLYSVKEDFGDKLPAHLKILEKPDWDGHYPSYPDMNNVIEMLCLHGIINGDRWILLGRDILPSLLDFPFELGERMYEIACERPGFFRH